MRLIDADLLKESISKRLKSFNPDGTEIEVADALALVNTMMEIDEQPTAFDMDEVIKQLEKEKEIDFELSDIANVIWNDAIQRAIKIVKGCVVE